LGILTRDSVHLLKFIVLKHYRAAEKILVRIICKFFPCEKHRGRTTYRSVGLREIVYGNGEEDIEEDIVAADEQDDEIEAEQEPETLQQTIMSDLEIMKKLFK
jgi:hypothetical protein